MFLSHGLLKFLLHRNKVREETHLILSSMLHYLFIDNFIHNLETLDGLLLCDTNVSLLQGHRAETAKKNIAVIRDDYAKTNKHIRLKCPLKLDLINGIPIVKVEETLGRIYTQAGSHILIVGQCGAEAQQTHVLLGELHIADCPRHQRFQHGPTVIMQQVDFILHNTFTLL